ncbi:hypothetical protein llap_11314 [Limosa lapponica baueri]|uniref:Uncharacterized protein n=1 Tax=Limosa lapponica baueri TaxID=1758121 RepID=A0A2I0TX92_LIMLA|nr:hypothetical protein llap_11314 [Limosa lapponica baueri]
MRGVMVLQNKNGLTLLKNWKEFEHNPERTTFRIVFKSSLVSRLPDVPAELTNRSCSEELCHVVLFHPGMAEHCGVLLYFTPPPDVGILFVPLKTLQF